jgi:hypothetical protein
MSRLEWKKPFLVVRSPERALADRLTSEFFRAWWGEHGFSERDLAAMLQISKSTARDKLTGRAHIGLHEVKMLKPALREAFLASYCRFLDEDDDLSDGPDGLHG